MANDVNKMILIGRLGGDPDLRFTRSGSAVVNFSVATSESWKDKETNTKSERTEWHRVVIFGKLAEIAGEYLKKGSQVYLEGPMRTRKWKDTDGKENYTTELHVDDMKMLGSRASRPEDASQTPTPVPENKPQVRPQEVTSQQVTSQQVIPQGVTADKSAAVS